jgi:hypothetical protein
MRICNSHVGSIDIHHNLAIIGPKPIIVAKHSMIQNPGLIKYLPNVTFGGKDSNTVAIVKHL